MRYYKIVITDPSSGQVFVPPGFAGLLGGASYTSFVNGQTLPSAWNIELDIPVIGQATPQGSGILRVWGISIQEINQAANLNGKNIAVYGGMQKGLPLANPAQAGLLVQGTIFQAFGNWIGTDQTLDFVIVPLFGNSSTKGGVGTLAQPKNIVLNWKAGTTLASALQTSLQTAFPGSTVKININSGLVRPNDEVGFYPTLEQLSQYVLQTSLDVIKTANYPGVNISVAGSTIAVSDNPAGNVQIAFQDLIGQPTWLEGATIQMKTVMRADLPYFGAITMPKALITNSSAAPTSLINLNATFQGGFYVTGLRHVGNFRQPTADSWVTVVDLAPNKLVGAAAAA
jgi:hypothetical protein